MVLKIEQQICGVMIVSGFIITLFLYFLLNLNHSYILTTFIGFFLFQFPTLFNMILCT